MSHQSDLIATNIDAYLAQHEQKELLRFLTCGSVDDGKSTLIGRLLYDSKMIYEDQLEAVKSDTSKYGTTGEKLDLALLVDGLQAEREQGITIDVAYRYFSTSKRKFIIADTPGHEQYTRNMATGASTCDLAIILIDARYGLQTQTRRHSYIASLLGIKHIVVAINKMDLLAFSERTFNTIRQEYAAFAKNLGLSKDIYFVPMSALDGDNVVNISERSPWYTGQPLMEILETAEVAADKNISDFRFPVQYVNRPNLDFRGFCGTIASGIVKKGDKVSILPSGKTSSVKKIVTYEGDLQEGFVGQAVTLTLSDEVDISRGDMIVHANAQVDTTNHMQAHLVWMSESQLNPGRQYFFKFSSKLTTGTVTVINHQVDVNSQEFLPKDHLDLNDIAHVEVELNQPVVIDPYSQNRATGAFIMIDRLTNITVSAGMITQALKTSNERLLDPTDISEFEVGLKILIDKHFPNKSKNELIALIRKIRSFCQ